MSRVNKDLLREREKCTFDPIELTNLLDGSPEKTARRRETGETSRVFTCLNLRVTAARLKKITITITTIIAHIFVCTNFSGFMRTDILYRH